MADDIVSVEDKNVTSSGQSDEDQSIYQEFSLEKLLPIIAETIENTTTQKITAAEGYLKIGKYEEVRRILREVREMNQVLLQITRHPDQPIPIDDRYKDRPMIDLRKVCFGEEPYQKAA